MGKAAARRKSPSQTSANPRHAKRSAILRDATCIFRRQGFHNTSMEDIAAAVKVSKATLYNYVRDKQDILFKCHLLALDIGAKAYELSCERGGVGHDRLILMITSYISFIYDELGPGGIMIELGALRDEDRKVVVNRRFQAEAQMIQIVEDGIRDKSIRSVNPKLAVFTLMGAVNAMDYWYSPAGRLSATELAVGMVDLIMHGLASNDCVDRAAPT